MAGSGGIDVAGSDAPAGATAKLVNGRAIAPVGAPKRVVRAITAANRIVNGRPYCLGGGHAALAVAVLRLLGHASATRSASPARR